MTVRVVARSRAAAVSAAALAGLLAGGCATMHTGSRGALEMWAFTAPWDPRSAASVAAHGDELDAVVSGFITLDSASFRPVTLYGDSAGHANPENRRLLALVTSYHGTHFHVETIRGLASDSVALGHTAGATAALLERGGYRGAVLDFEGMTPNDLDALLRVSRAMTDSGRAHGIAPIGMAIPATDTAAYPARPLLGAVDFLAVMLYDQHWSTSPPGPIASPDWVARGLGVRVGEVGPGRLIAALPVYGYAWRSDSATAVVSYADAEKLARDAHVALTRDPASQTLHASAGVWNAWVSDAVQLDTLMRTARALGITRFALWRAGLEDPRVWTTIAAHRAP